MTARAVVRVGRRVWLEDPGDVGRLELVKWVAFAAMIADHVDLWLYGRGFGMQALGAFAFPAFAFCFGLGLARSRDPMMVGARLVLPALFAQVAWFMGGFEHPLNVLGVFALCAFAMMPSAPPWGRIALWGVVVVACGVGGEGGAFGALMAGAGVLAGLRRGWGPVFAAGGVWCLLLPSTAAVLSVVAVVLAPSRWPRLGRVRGLFAWAYAFHLLVLLLLVSARSLIV